MRTVFVNSATDERVLQKLLEPYGVDVHYGAYEYKEMVFPDHSENAFKALFFDTMAYLASKDISVTAYNVLVQEGGNPATADYVSFSNRWHDRNSRADFAVRDRIDRQQQAIEW